MSDKLDETMNQIARQQLILSHRVAVWCTLAKGDPHDDRTQNAAELAIVEANILQRTIYDAAGYTG